jgi:methionyl-tRNA formyltransferase
MQRLASPVKRLAMTRGLPIIQPETLKSPEVAEQLNALHADAMVVAAYGLILPSTVLATVPQALNIHASLLPRWRGAAPIARAILAGDRETGISIMRMDEGLDTGPILARASLPIASDDDAGTLHDKLATLGEQMILSALAELAAGRGHLVPQSEPDATYAAKIEKHETILDWSRPAVELERVVRAFRPIPGAMTFANGEALKVWRAHVLDQHGNPGVLLRASNALVVACSKGALAISEVQRPGGKRIAADQFVLGRTLSPGMRFGTAP